MTHTEFNAGNFQEYDYECECIECYWKNIYGMANLVSAFYYPWLDLKNQPLYTNH